MTLQTGTRISVHFTGNDLVLWLQNVLKFTASIPLLPQAIFQIRQLLDPYSMIWRRMRYMPSLVDLIPLRDKCSGG
jgi:hypothetical protein